jgi:hypothetical protein
MNLINLTEQWDNEARRCFARADKENNSIEKRIWESKASLIQSCACELRECLISPLLSSLDIQRLSSKKRRRQS